MRISIFFASILIALLLPAILLAQISDRILKHYEGFAEWELEQGEISHPFSAQITCRATVTKEKLDGSYYMMAFATDKLQHTVIYADVSDISSERVSMYGEPGTGDGQFLCPMGAAADHFGNVYIADMGNNRIVKLNCDFETGEMIFVQNITSDFNNPFDVTISTNGTPDNHDDDRIWVADCGNHRIVELSKDGVFLRSFGSEGTGTMEFRSPSTLKVYEYGDNNTVSLSVGDAGNHRLVNMGTDGTWYEVPLTETDEIVSIDVYDEEIYVLEKFCGLVHKIRWPDIYLSSFSSNPSASASYSRGFSFPNSMSVPFPEQMPYVCVFEQLTYDTGCKLKVQGVDVMDLEGAPNVNGTAVQVGYRLPTNSVVTEIIVDEYGNVVKTLTDSIIIDSSPEVSATWYCDNENGEPVEGGTYYYKCTTKTKWEYDDSGVPLGKRILNSIFSSGSSGEPGDTLTKTVRIDMPITLTVSPGPDDGLDNSLYWNNYWPDAVYENEGNIDHISVGPRTAGGSSYKIKRAILKFDLSNTDLTPHDKVTDASFMLRLRAMDNTDAQTINVHRILVPWDEMTSCWNRPHDSADSWDGCEPDDNFTSVEPSGSITVSTQSGWYEWFGDGMIELVQDWITNPSSNYGVLIKIVNDNRNEDHQFRFWSSDVSDSTLHPRLEIVYEKNVLYPMFKAEIVAEPTSGRAPLTVKFDGSNSYSPSGIETYSWDFDISDETEEDTVGKVVYHTFESAGDWTVSLTTIDSANIWGYDTLTVHVDPQIMTTVLQPGPEDGKDNSLEILWGASWSGNDKYGNLIQIIVGTEDEDDPYYRRYRAILKFDLSGITSGSNVESATLKLNCYQYCQGTHVFNVHKILPEGNWIETESCWNYPKYGGASWNGCNPDGTYASSTVSASLTKTGQTGWYEWDVTDLVQSWVDSTSQNEGMLVKIQNDAISTTRRFRFYSSDHGSPSVRPILEITYELEGGMGKKKPPGEFLVETKKVPQEFELKQNYPNPFNPSTTINYQLPDAVHVSMKVYDMLGREIATLVDEKMDAGYHQITWDGKDRYGIPISSGIYIIRVIAGNYTSTRKMLLIK